MIVVMESSASESSVEAVIAYLLQSGCDVHRSSGQTRTILGVVGNVTDSDRAVIEELPSVARVVRVSEPYKLASRRFRQHPTVLDGEWGIIGSEQPWIAMEPVGLRLKKIRSDSNPPPASLSYEVAAARSFDAAVTRLPQAMENVGSLACLSVHPKPTDVRWPVLFVTREPSWGPDEWICAAERELERGTSCVVLLEAGGQCPGGLPTLEITSIARTSTLTHLPIVVDVPEIAQRSRYCEAVASAALAAGAAGVILRVWVGNEGSIPRAAATLSWEAAVQLANRLRAMREAMRR